MHDACSAYMSGSFAFMMMQFVVTLMSKNEFDLHGWTVAALRWFVVGVIELRSGNTVFFFLCVVGALSSKSLIYSQ